MVTLKELEPELTAEEKRELEAAENRIPVSDEDCPEMTIEQLGQFWRMESEVTHETESYNAIPNTEK